MSDAHHGADRVADFLDKPLPEGGTHRKRVATIQMKHYLLAALLIGCGIEPTPKLERLEVAAIPGIPLYRAGKVFHPWRADLEEPDRYPMPAPGKASDAQCWMGDSYFLDCAIYECDAALTCPTGWTCKDVRLQMDPPQDVAQDEGWLLYKYPAYHLAACVKP